MDRRCFLRNSGVFALGLFAGCAPPGTAADQPPPHSAQRWTMPEEGEPHERTWMAFGASARIWGHRLLPEVQRNLAEIANTIAYYEPVSMLVREGEMELARSLLDPSVELIPAPLDDLWVRDTGPTFVFDEQDALAAVDFNFNGWGKKQQFAQDAKVASFIAEQAQVPVVQADLILEGGCFEVDGQGTAILTESCVLNNNRNPGLSKSHFEDLFMPLLGLDKIIWLPGIRGRDITDGHTDFYVRFAKPGVVVAGYDPYPESYDREVTLAHLEILASATDAAGRTLRVETLEAPGTIRGAYASGEFADDFAAGYIGYYLCNGAVIMQQFGDGVTDRQARDTLQQIFPERDIVPLAIDGIAAGGGSIHCATQQQPLA